MERIAKVELFEQIRGEYEWSGDDQVGRPQGGI